MTISKEVIDGLASPYYCLNFFLSTFYFISKLFPYCCDLLYDKCNLEFQEYEMMIMLASFMTLSKRRTSTLLEYIAHFLMFAKLCNLVMFYRYNAIYGAVYGFIWFLCSIMVKKPVYRGPDKVLYLRDTTFEDEVLNPTKNKTWIVAFYTNWSPACNRLAPIFAELSHKYSTDDFKFGKIDITRYGDVATKNFIDTGTLSNQLPTIILFKNGKEVERRPAIDPKKKKVIQKYNFNYDSIIKSFELEKYSNMKQEKSQVSKKTD